MFWGSDRHGTTRLLFTLFVSVQLGWGVMGCGAARDTGGSSSSAPSNVTAGLNAAPSTSSVIPPGQLLRGDGDADNPNDIDGNGDSDAASVGGPDTDNDNPTPESYDFPDKDDRSTFAYGHPSKGSAGRAISSVVSRYYAAAAAGDGAAACPLLVSSFARSVPEVYAGPGGLPYLQGGKTCQVVLSMFFQHFHEQLAEAITMIQVRVEGSDAQVIFSSRKMPASRIFLVRQDGSWKIPALLGQPLP